MTAYDELDRLMTEYDDKMHRLIIKFNRRQRETGGCPVKNANELIQDLKCIMGFEAIDLLKDMLKEGNIYERN